MLDLGGALSVLPQQRKQPAGTKTEGTSTSDPSERTQASLQQRPLHLAKDQAGIVTAEAKTVVQCVLHFLFASFIRHVV